MYEFPERNRSQTFLFANAPAQHSRACPRPCARARRLALNRFILHPASKKPPHLISTLETEATCPPNSHFFQESPNLSLQHEGLGVK